MKTWEQIITEKFGKWIDYVPSGLPSTRKGSNLHAAITSLRERGMGQKFYAVAGAHNYNGTDGYKWYIFEGQKPDVYYYRPIVTFYYPPVERL